MSCPFAQGLTTRLFGFPFGFGNREPVSGHFSRKIEIAVAFFVPSKLVLPFSPSGLSLREIQTFACGQIGMN
jgi:hypothetical protein